MKDTEPAPLGGEVCFESWDFASLAPAHERDPEWNARRLAARRRLSTLGKALAARVRKASDLDLEVRTSIHNPHAFNGGRVRRLWAYLTRSKAEKRRLRKVLGAELAKDLDSAYRNAYLCLAIEPTRLEVSLRIHPDAWYDGKNLENRIQSEGIEGLLEELRLLDGFVLRLSDWKGEWPCGEGMPRERLEDFLRFWKVGEQGLVIDRRWPVPERGPALEAACTPQAPRQLLDELERLVPLFRYAVWSGESDFLFSGGSSS